MGILRLLMFDFTSDSHLTARMTLSCLYLSFIHHGISSYYDLYEIPKNLREMSSSQSWLFYPILLPVLRAFTGGSYQLGKCSATDLYLYSSLAILDPCDCFFYDGQPCSQPFLAHLIPGLYQRWFELPSAPVCMESAGLWRSQPAVFLMSVLVVIFF